MQAADGLCIRSGVFPLENPPDASLRGPATAPKISVTVLSHTCRTAKQWGEQRKGNQGVPPDTWKRFLDKFLWGTAHTVKQILTCKLIVHRCSLQLKRNPVSVDFSPDPLLKWQLISCNRAEIWKKTNALKFNLRTFWSFASDDWLFICSVHPYNVVRVSFPFKTDTNLAVKDKYTAYLLEPLVQNITKLDSRVTC